MMKTKLQKVAPSDIETRSMEIITEELSKFPDFQNYPQAQLPVLKRVIHTTADFSYVENLLFSPEVIEKGVSALKRGCTIVTDTQMVWSGINKKVLESFGGKAVCFMSDETVAKEAKERGETRATLSMERASQLEGEVIFALGNAPTALVRVCELAQEGKIAPSLVIGVPVGFVNVVESKEFLLETEVPYIVSRGRKGGSNVAAAICNALLYVASHDKRE